MFVQCIQGAVADAAGLQRQTERWMDELRPGAAGFLGSTEGVTGDGTFFMAARFESADAARRNSERREQGDWWAETEKCFSGDVTFDDYADIEVLKDGGSDDAGFVQVIRGSVNDAAAMRQLTREESRADTREDVIGGYNALKPDGSYTTIIYFTSEAAAREGEKLETETGNSFIEQMQAMQTAPPTFLDLADPQLYSA